MTNDIKQKIKLRSTKLDIYQLITKLANIYKMTNLNIIDIKDDYDTYEILIGNLEPKYILSLQFDFEKISFIAKENNYQDNYKIKQGNLYFKERIYKANYNTKLIYNPCNIIKNVNYSNNKIYFGNNFLKTTISYKFKDKKEEELLIFNLLNNSIKNIYDLYQAIAKIIKEEIIITSYHKNYPEHIKVKNQELISCYLKDLETGNFYKYQNKELVVISKSNPETNQEFLKIRKKIRS